MEYRSLQFFRDILTKQHRQCESRKLNILFNFEIFYYLHAVCCFIAINLLMKNVKFI